MRVVPKFSLQTSILLLMACALQIQIQGYLIGDVSLNISPSDIILLALAILVLWPFGQQYWGILVFKSKISWFLLLFIGILTFSLFTGTRDTWAIKKYLSFYVLLLYWVSGMAISVSGAKEAFAKAFIVFFNGVSIVFFIDSFLRNHEFLHAGALRPIQEVALAGNPNIFGFLGCIALALNLSYEERFKDKVWMCRLLLLWEIISIFSSGSRASWIVGLFIIGYSLVLYKKTRVSLGLVGAFLLLTFSTFCFFKERLDHSYDPFSFNVERISSKKADLLWENEPSVNQRMCITKDAVQCILEKPFLGQGLGVMWKRAQTVLNLPHIIHSTPLWILSETGIVGFFLFVTIFFLFLRCFYHQSRKTRDPFASAMVLILLSAGIFSLAHEILYQRVLWFMIGIGMSQAREKKDSSKITLKTTASSPSL